MAKFLRQKSLLRAVLIVFATLLAYLPCLHGQFLWDDDAWTTGIHHLLKNTAGLGVIWIKPTALQQYYPLTATTFWIDYHIWGFWTLPYHVENVLLHALAAVLFAHLLLKLQVPGAWLAGAIFALHPVMVESAAWITERKNVLSLVLFLGALLSYGRFAGFWKQDRDLFVPLGDPAAKHDWLSYLMANAFFLAACLSKTISISLPPVLLLIAWWKRGRFQWRSDVLPTLPFVGVGLGLGLITWWLERNQVGNGPSWSLSLAERCLIAGRALWFYAGKIVWPANLCFIYPRWQVTAASWAQWLWPAAAISTLLCLWAARKRIGRGPLTAVLFFVITVSPLLGFITAYFMRYSFVCDHWSYLPSLGLIALGAAALVRTAAVVRKPVLIRFCAALILPVLGLLTYGQCQMYWDAETLYRTTLERNPDAELAHNNLGALLFEQNRIPEAMVHFQRAVEIGPASAQAHNNLANALRVTGDEREAAQHYEQALGLEPDNIKTCNNLAMLLASSPDPLLRNGQRALQLALRANELSASTNPVLLGTLAAAYAEEGRFAEATKAVEQAIVAASEHTNSGFSDFLKMQRQLYLNKLAFHEQRKTWEQPKAAVDTPSP